MAGTLPRTVVGRGRGDGLECGVVRRIEVVVRMPDVLVEADDVAADATRLVEGTSTSSSDELPQAPTLDDGERGQGSAPGGLWGAHRRS